MERSKMSGGTKKQYKQYPINSIQEACQVHMSTEKSVNRSLKIRSLLTWFGTCRIPSAGAVTT